jgi:outer membrane protein TolC
VASLGPNVSQTLYAGGALAANRDVAIARLDQALLNYRRTGLNALREVADALKAHEEAGVQLERQGERVVAQREALRLADKRFGAGVVSFMEVLDAQRQLLAAETDFVNTRLARQLAYVQVYRALGGGWTPPAAAPSGS